MNTCYRSSVLLVYLVVGARLCAAESSPVAPITSLDGQWSLAIDPQNVGREQKWFQRPSLEASRPTRVPWIIQATFPGRHGVAWYAREFAAPVNPHPGGRYLLRFWQVDYLAEVWLNGQPVGRHEGNEGVFVFDVTATIKPGAKNRLVVRVLNPTHEPIDGIVLRQIPHRNKELPYRAGAAYNHGGIMDSVELRLAPALRVDDVWARPDPQTGVIRVRATVVNASSQPVRGTLDFTVAQSPAGAALAACQQPREFAPGETIVPAEIRLAQPRRWDLAEPNLYRLTARVAAEQSSAFDEQSVRCGFRDFRFADGYFRLNGRRIYLRCSHTGNNAPIGMQLPTDPDTLRQDLVNVKAMGFNAIRFIAGIGMRDQLDLCDEIGMLVYEESFAGWCMEDSPQMKARLERSTDEMIRRDRNHPSIVIWGLLNETRPDPIFHHALGMLPLFRALDPDRLVLLNSGRWDELQKENGIGSLANPGSTVWEDVLSDVHTYPRVPHTGETIQLLRTRAGTRGKPVFVSEYGIGSAVDLWRTVRHYERRGADELDDARFYRDKLTRFEADWTRWRLDEAFARPEDFFMECLKKMAGQRALGLNAIRANPNIISHSVTGTVDQGMTGEGLTTTFREFKPGTVDAMFDGWAPLRWCLFAEPPHAARGAKVRLEAVLANEDALKPGAYRARLEVVGPNLTRVWNRTLTITIPERNGTAEPPLAQTCLAEDVPIDGPTGQYQFLATFERGAAAAGGRAEFYITDPADMPRVETEVILWGEDPTLAQWLTSHHIRTRPYSASPRRPEGPKSDSPLPLAGEGPKSVSPRSLAGEGLGVRGLCPAAPSVILASSKPPAPGGAAVFADLTRRIAAGSNVVFLSPAVFARGRDRTAWLPLEPKGKLTTIRGWLYLKDEWAKRHPIFDGLPAGGLMDYIYYRELIPDDVWQDQAPPAEAVAGAIKASQDYSSGLMVGVYRLGEGRLVLNTLRIRENLDTHPAAERLLRNMLRYAAPASRPTASRGSTN